MVIWCLCKSIKERHFMRTQRTSFWVAAITGILAALLPIATCGAKAADGPGAGAAATPSAQPAAAPAPGYPEGVSEVLKLYKGGVPAEIIVNYINNSPLAFYLSADNVIALQQQGVPPQVITAMIQRNGQMQRQTAQAWQQGAAQAAQAPAVSYQYPQDNAAENFNNALQARAANPAYYPTPAPSYPVYYPTYDYDYYYPYYPYAYTYWPPVYFGFGFGHGWGGYAHGGIAHGGFAGHGAAVGHAAGRR
jgi:hypothetical protein